MEIKPQLIRNLQIGGIVIALALVAFGIYQTVGNTPFSFWDDDAKQPYKPEVAVKSTPPTDELPYLPQDFPIDKNATVIHNYTTTSPQQTNVEQHTRAYASSRTQADLYKTYNDYFKRNNWTIISSAQVKGSAGISALKDKVVVSVSIQDLKTTRMIVITVGESSQSFQPQSEISTTPPLPKP